MNNIALRFSAGKAVYDSNQLRQHLGKNGFSEFQDGLNVKQGLGKHRKKVLDTMPDGAEVSFDVKPSGCMQSVWDGGAGIHRYYHDIPTLTATIKTPSGTTVNDIRPKMKEGDGVIQSERSFAKQIVRELARLIQTDNK